MKPGQPTRPPLEDIFRSTSPDSSDPLKFAQNRLLLFPGISTNWTVITGPPSSGKTTSKDGLDSLGFPTVAEAARIVLKRATDAGYTNEDIYADAMHELRQGAVLQEGLSRELKTDPDIPCILDRSFLDAIPFSHVLGIDCAPYERLADLFRYRRVIYLESLPLVGDNERPEDAKFEELRRAIDTRTREFYQELGYKLIIIPAYKEDRSVFEKHERLVMVLQAIGVSGGNWLG